MSVFGPTSLAMKANHLAYSFPIPFHQTNHLMIWSKQKTESNFLITLTQLTGFIIFLCADESEINLKYGSLFLSVPGTYSITPPLIAWQSNNSHPHYRKAVAIAIGAISLNAGGILSTWVCNHMFLVEKVVSQLTFFCSFSYLFLFHFVRRNDSCSLNPNHLLIVPRLPSTWLCEPFSSSYIPPSLFPRYQKLEKNAIGWLTWLRDVFMMIISNLCTYLKKKKLLRCGSVCTTESSLAQLCQ